MIQNLNKIFFFIFSFLIVFYFSLNVFSEVVVSDETVKTNSQFNSKANTKSNTKSSATSNKVNSNESKTHSNPSANSNSTSVLSSTPTLNSTPSRVSLVTKVVGSVGDYFLTSREVIAGRYIEKVLFPSNQNSEIATQLDTPLFSRQMTSALLERVVSMEAENFSVSKVEEAELKEAVQKVQKTLTSEKGWTSLQIVDLELKDWVERKIRAKKFLKYKTESATLGVTDEEVKEYFDKNRYKFGNLPLQSFQDSIKSFLIKQQMEERLKEWFEILKKKYKVRNFLHE